MTSIKKKFIESNRRLWHKVQLKKDVALMEGRPYINQVIATSLIAKAIQEKESLPTIAWLSSNQDVDIYDSFEIEKIMYKKSYISKNKFYIYFMAFFQFLMLSIKYLAFNRNFNHFIDNYRIDGIRFGDMIYDKYIRNGFKFLKPSFFDKEFLNIFLKTMFEYYAIKYFGKEYNIKYVVIAKWQYNNSGGIMARYALFNGITVISALNDRARIWKNYESLFHDVYKVYKIDTSDFDLEKVNKAIKERFRGIGPSFDIKKTFSEKVWDLDDYEKYFGSDYDKEKKNVFIMLHAFSDANHIDGHLIYRDYYEWYVETLKIIAKIKDVNWIVKIHPSHKEYYEEGIAEEAFKKYKEKNVFLLPEAFNTKSLFSVAHAVVTGRGTIALEASLFGIPSILTGESNFSSLGFTHNMKSIEEYKENLRNILYLERLSEEKILLARQAFNNYGLLMGSKFDSNIHSWVSTPSFAPSQSLSQKNKIEDAYLQTILDNFTEDNVGKNNVYYKDIFSKL